MNRLISPLFLVISLAVLAGCTKTDPKKDDPTPIKVTSNRPVPQKSLTQINGTRISPGVDVAGVLVDSKTGKGIPGVAVTDGFIVVQTDANGVYQMKRNALCRRVYYTTPSSYKVNMDPEHHLPYFYSAYDLKEGTLYRLDFVLDPLDAPENDFTLLMISDPQCGKTTEVTRYKNETIPDIVDLFKRTSGKNVYAVTLGDVTYDSRDTWDPMRASMSNITDGTGRYLPFFQVAGNHDHDASLFVSTDADSLKQVKSTRYFVEYFGPTDYSFDRGNAHIVCLDNIKVKGSSSTTQPNKVTCTYSVGLFDCKYRWLKQDLAAVKDKGDKVLIMCMHGNVCSSTSGHFPDMFKLMAEFKEAHLMIGHTHKMYNYLHTEYKTKGGTPVYEHIHGAACGAWWMTSLNKAGAPNGYGVYNISGSGVRNWFYKSTGKKDDYQMRVYDGNQTYSPDSKYPLNWYTNTTFPHYTAKGNPDAKGAFVAQIWNADPSNWKVEFWQGGKKVGNFKKMDNGYSCMCVTSYWIDRIAACATSTVDWSAPQRHGLWYYKPASATPTAEKDWEVRAIFTNPGSGEVSTYTRNSLTVNFSEF